MITRFKTHPVTNLASKNIVLGTELNGVNSLNYGQVVILVSCNCTALSGALIRCIYLDSVSLIRECFAVFDRRSLTARSFSSLYLFLSHSRH